MVYPVKRECDRRKKNSPDSSRTSTLCFLVDTVTGTDGEPGVGGEREGDKIKKKEKKKRGECSSERNIACHPLGGKVNWVKCSTLPANCKRRILNGSSLVSLARLSEADAAVGSLSPGDLR